MRDNSATSSKTIQSDSFRVAISRESSIEKSASSTSNPAKLCMTSRLEIPTCDASGSTAIIVPTNTSPVFPPTIKVTLSGVLEFFHISNLSNASEDEAIYFNSLFFHLCAKAKVLARESDGKCDRAYQAILSAIADVS